MPLSARTEPTEKEAREALCRVLLSIAFDYPPDDKRSRVLGTLISVFSSLKPSFPILRPSPFKAVLKRHNQSREDPWRDLAIAMAVKNRRAGGLSYHAATAEVAEAFGYKDTRHVKAIYGRWRPRLGEPPVASDKPTSDMMPDS